MEICILLLVTLAIIEGVREINIAREYKKYPLDEQVEMNIDRELMNNRYKFLSEQEKEILEFTSDLNFSIYLTRRVTNKLVITVKKDSGEIKEWTVYQNEEVSDKWIKYLKTEYFTKTKKLNKVWKCLMEK